MKIYNENVCVFSDIHMGIHGSSSIWHKITLDFCTWTRDILLEKNIKDIIICGDIFDDRNELALSTLDTAYTFFETLKDFNIIITVGNHDAYYKLRSDVNSIKLLNGWSNISVVQEITTINVFDKRLTFCPWGTKAKDIPKSDIVFGHFEINNFKQTRGKICDTGIGSQSLLNKSPLIITGHFHLKSRKEYKKGEIVYLGCPYELNWNDWNDTKGIYILDIPAGDINFIENKLSPKHKRIKLSDFLNNKIVDIKSILNNNFINFIIDSEIDSEKLEQIIEKISNCGSHSFSVDYNNKQFLLEETDFEFTKVNISESIVEFIKLLDLGENIKEKEVIDYTLDLYSRVK